MRRRKTKAFRLDGRFAPHFSARQRATDRIDIRMGDRTVDHWDSGWRRVPLLYVGETH